MKKVKRAVEAELLPKVWVKTGLCFFCILPIEALQPGGSDPRHVGTKIQYGYCAHALARKPAKVAA